MSDGLDFIKVANFEMNSRLRRVVRLQGSDQQKKAGVLSGGERNRLNLALTLKMGGNMLLLDEPTNDLDVETLSSLEDALLDFPAVPWSPPTTGGSSTASPPTSWPGRATTRTREVVLVRGQLRVYEENKVERLGVEAAAPQAHHRQLTRD